MSMTGIFHPSEKYRSPFPGRTKCCREKWRCYSGHCNASAVTTVPDPTESISPIFMALPPRFRAASLAWRSASSTAELSLVEESTLFPFTVPSGVQAELSSTTRMLDVFCGLLEQATENRQMDASARNDFIFTSPGCRVLHCERLCVYAGALTRQVGAC